MSTFDITRLTDTRSGWLIQPAPEPDHGKCSSQTFALQITRYRQQQVSNGYHPTQRSTMVISRKDQRRVGATLLVINGDTDGGLLDHIRVTFKIATADQLIDPIEQQLEQMCEVLQLFQAKARQDTIHVGAPGLLD